MVKTIFSGAWRIGRATALALGVAVMLALVVGLASTAFARNGDAWKLGTGNVATKITTLAGSLGVNGPMVRLVNNNAGTDDTALELRVQTGEAPMQVNSSTRVDSLNADQIDGQSASSFVANSTYLLGQGQERAGTVLGDGSKVLSQACLAGDTLLSGGPASVNVNSDVLDSFAQNTTTWQARINDSAVSGGDSFTVVVLCANQ